MSIRLKRDDFTQTVRLGRKRLRVRISGEGSLTAILSAARRVNEPDADPAQIAVELITGIFGEEAAREIFAFYDYRNGETAERTLPLLLGRVMRNAVRVQKKRQKERARMYR